MKHHALMRMIKEAGGGQSRHPEKWDVWEFHDDAVERFAKLVAEAEREACAKLCDYANKEYEPFTGQLRALNYTCADLIRARGKE